jgi:hypothetical protein
MCSMSRSHNFSTRSRLTDVSLTLLLATLCVISNVAQGDIYSFTDANGAQSFSNVPTDERYILMLRTDEFKEPVKSDVSTSNNSNRSQQRFFAPEINRAAMIYHLDPALLHAVIATESGYEANAVSRKGAMGLMQLMPETARRYGATDPFNPAQNIHAGAQYLNSLLRRFGNNLYLALAAYNSGEANVVKYGQRITPFAETTAYVPKVMGLYRKYQHEVW